MRIEKEITTHWNDFLYSCVCGGGGGGYHKDTTCRCFCSMEAGEVKHIHNDKLYTMNMEDNRILYLFVISQRSGKSHDIHKQQYFFNKKGTKVSK